jgi:transposase
MDNAESLELESETIDALPIINHFIDRLGLDQIIKCAMPNADPSNHIMPYTSIGMLLRNIIIGRLPVYGFKEWVTLFDPQLFNLKPDQVDYINDDRIGRALEKLFDTDRASLMTEIVLKAVHEFDLKMDQFHNDSTSITFQGRYEDANGDKKRGKETLKITRGHNKDHRPDLKQLVFDLTVTSDGAVPIHYKGYDGNRTDDTTHIETWDILKELKGSPDFIYVADSKLCVSETMRYIGGEDGFFITVMPRTRSEDKWFREHIIDNKVLWNEVFIVQDPRKKKDLPEIWRMVESPIPSKEGFRIAWVWSSKKTKQDQISRENTINKAISGLKGLQKRLQSNRCRLKTKQAVSSEAEKIVEEAGANRWIDPDVVEKIEKTHKQEKKGRPGANTRYVAIERTCFQVNWEIDNTNVKADACSDGMFPLITNCEEISLKEILEKYKYQPKLEKRHEQFKTVYGIAPVLLKNITRVEALLFVFFVTLLVQSMIEREIRLNMKKAGLEGIPIYPEKRQSASPTTDKVLNLFNNIQRHHLIDNGVMVKTFNPKLNEVQVFVLDLLKIPQSVYTEYS